MQPLQPTLGKQITITASPEAPTGATAVVMAIVNADGSKSIQIDTTTPVEAPTTTTDIINPERLVSMRARADKMTADAAAFSDYVTSLEAQIQ